MSGVSVNYKGTTIANMDSSGTKTLKTSGKYCEGDITIQYDEPTTGSAGITPSGTKTITSNGTHDVTAYANAEVNVPIPSGYIKPSGTKTIAENGTHDVTNFASVEVAVENSGGGSATNGKIFRFTKASRETTSKWVTLVEADADILAHKGDTTLCVSFHMVTPVSGAAAQTGGIQTASPITADGKYGVAVRQTSSNAISPSSLANSLRSGSASSYNMHVTDDGAVRIYQYGTYPLNVGEYIIAVSW